MSERPTEISAGDTKAIQNRVDAASLGKWVIQPVDHGTGIKDFDIVEGAEDPVYANSMARVYDREVADFIVNAPDDIRTLLAENARLQAELDAQSERAPGVAAVISLKRKVATLQAELAAARKALGGE